MNAATAEWVEKAEGDFRSAQRELRVRSRPNHDLVCFLSQQCAEKYLKGLLIESNRPFRKVHDLEELLDALLPIAPQLETYRKGLASLTDHAVDFRYPGESATKDVAKAAFTKCRVVRKEIRKILGADEPPSAQMNLRIKERRARYKVSRKKRVRR